MGQKTGIMAILAIISSIVSYFLSFSGRPIWGLILGVLALPFGIIGFIMAASPRVSGGIISIISIILGLIAIGIAVLVFIGVILF